MADLSPLMVWITNPDAYCIYLNKHWYEFTGQEPHAGEGDGWTLAVHSEDRNAARMAFVEATQKTVPYHVEYRLCRHDHGFEWVSAVGHPYFTVDGKLGGYIGSDASAVGIRVRNPHGWVLTSREREIVGWIARGKTSSEIAQIVGISQRTVEQHAAASMLKLGACNRVQAAVEALRRGEIDP